MQIENLYDKQTNKQKQKKNNYIVYCYYLQTQQLIIICSINYFLFIKNKIK